MRKDLFFLFFFCLCNSSLKAQSNNDFPFGSFGPDSFSRLTPSDSNTKAIMLNEFGSATLHIEFIPDLTFYYHARIRIQNEKGFEKANLSIPIQKSGDKFETLEDFRAISASFIDGELVKHEIKKEQLYREINSEYQDNYKVVLPDIAVGSIIEFQYKINSPFIRNLRTWEFQSDIPKLRSSFNTIIPSLYEFRVRKRGELDFLTLTKEDLPDCQRINGSAVYCRSEVFSMKSVPPFRDENYTSGQKNHLSALYFELTSITRNNGSKDDLSSTWASVDQELRRHEKFGKEILKNHKKFWQSALPDSIRLEKDSMELLKKSDAFIKQHLAFNDYFGIYCKYPVTDEFAKQSGNVADINFCLFSLLRFLNLDANIVVLSTRNHGIIEHEFPVISDFNYVVVSCNINGKKYLLDATDKNLPFGLLPPRCLNGYCREIRKNFKSAPFSISADTGAVTSSIVHLRFEGGGQLSGEVSQKFYGYDAYEERNVIRSFSSQQQYLQGLNQMHEMEIESNTIMHLEEFEKPLAIVLQVKNILSDSSSGTALVNPFFNYRFVSNPFNAKFRTYPIDFTYPRTWKFNSTIELPGNFQVLSVPDSVEVETSRKGAKYFFVVNYDNKRIAVKSEMIISRTLFAPSEFSELKKIFTKAIQTHSEEIVIRKADD